MTEPTTIPVITATLAVDLSLSAPGRQQYDAWQALASLGATRRVRLYVGDRTPEPGAVELIADYAEHFSLRIDIQGCGDVLGAWCGEIRAAVHAQIVRKTGWSEPR